MFKLSPPAPGKTAWTKTTLFRFSGGIDGGNPAGALLRDSSGALYGTTLIGGRGPCTDQVFNQVIGCGTVFKLTPPLPGQTAWRASVLYNFTGPDGAFPQGGVIADTAGRLHGTASAGGQQGSGVVYELLPPAPGYSAWTSRVLHQFNVSTSGSLPNGNLVANPAGQLFGVTWAGGVGLGGTVFQVTR